MIRVTDLPFGWALYADPATGDPWLRKGSGGDRMPHEVARSESVHVAHEIYRAISRELNRMDWEWRLCGNEARFTATDSAAMVMESMLKKCERWDPRLKVHGAEQVEAA